MAPSTAFPTSFYLSSRALNDPTSPSLSAKHLRKAKQNRDRFLHVRSDRSIVLILRRLSNEEGSGPLEGQDLIPGDGKLGTNFSLKEVSEPVKKGKF
jgi:hypothetical protein